MSRRKQSNPKPLKRDEFWNEGDGSENGGGERSPAAPASEALGADTKPSPPPADEDEPKLKVNASLATDPALRESPAAPAAAADTSSPVDALRFKPDAGLPLFPSGSSAGIFCLPAVPEASVPRAVKQENLEAVVVAVPPPPPPVPAPRQGKRPFGAGGVEPLGGPAGGAAAVAAISCFTCLPCNIKFSSRSTLEAHQTYYCSHRASAAPPRPSSPATPLTGKEGSSDTEPGSPGGGEGAEESAPPAAKVARRQYACPHCSYSADKKVSLNRHMRMHAAAPVSPAAPATPASSDQEQPPDAEALAAAAAGAALPPPALDRYCANCDIRFSNVRTYKAHKAHYCDTRHVVKPNAPSSPANASQASSGADLSRVGSAASPEASPAPPQAYLALPTTPVLLVPYHLVQAASLVTAPPLPAGAAHPSSACLVLLNGAVQPLELPPERPPTPPPPPPRRPEKHHRPSQASSEVCVNGGTFPLDLSLPRSGSGCGSDPEDEKENRGLNTSSPSQGSSRASSPASASPRPHHRLNGAAAPAKKQPEPPPTPPEALRKTPTTLLPPHLKLPKQLLVPELLGPLLGSQLALLQRPLLGAEAFQAAVGAAGVASPGAAGPQILVKQGTAKCESCNIVFCKLENFEVHKQYYCQGRSRPDAASAAASDAAPAATPSPPAAVQPQQPQQQPQTQAKLLQQFICGNCGIKFTSLNNLKAHQTYYCRDSHLQPANNCTNNNDPPPQDKKKCPKCKVSVGCEEAHECVVGAAGAVTSVLSSSGWRCPCCRSHLPTATAAQKHLEEQHAGLLRGFRCTICSYRGNTLRGMRTHIRAHLVQPPPVAAAHAQDKQGDVKEEDFIACVLHDELDAAAAAATSQAAADERPPAATPPAECSECDSHATPSPRPPAEAAAT